MASVGERLAAAKDAVRRVPPLRRVLDTVGHYGEVNGSLQAAGITYTAFLSLFPILALSFAVVGLVGRFVPDADAALVDVVEGIFPGLLTSKSGGEGIQISTFEDAAPAILSIGLPLALWTGLGWIDSVRTALVAVFGSTGEAPGFVAAKLRDLLALVLLGGVLLFSVAVSGVVSVMADQLLDWAGLGDHGGLVRLLAPVVGVAANTVLFYALFQVLARPPVPRRTLWVAGVIGGVGFEALKLGSAYLLAMTKDQPAFQVFGIALILLVWINYFARLLLYVAAWAQTSPRATAREIEGEND